VYTHTDTLARVQVPTDDPRFQSGVQNLKAVVQYLIDGLVHNSLYKWKESLHE
jgi:hypothetical protein